MSKEITDVIGRMAGDLLALQGMEAKISPPPPPPPPTVEQAAQPAAAGWKPKLEDYQYVKKLAEEIKGFCQTLEDLVDKETKVPPPPEAAAAPSS